MFPEKSSAIARNASEMRQKCVKMGLVLWGKRNAPKCVRNASKLRQKCVKNARNAFGGEHLLDDTEFLAGLLECKFVQFLASNVGGLQFGLRSFLLEIPKEIHHFPGLGGEAKKGTKICDQTLSVPIAWSPNRAPEPRNPNSAL